MTRTDLVGLPVEPEAPDLPTFDELCRQIGREVVCQFPTVHAAFIDYADRAEVDDKLYDLQTLLVEAFHNPRFAKELAEVYMPIFIGLDAHLGK